MTPVPSTDMRDAAVRAAALAAYDRGDADAADAITALLVVRPMDGGLLIADATLALEDKRSAPFDRLRAALRVAPDWLDGHDALARLRWGAGERDAFLQALEDALTVVPQHAGLWMRYMALLSDAGRPDRAADVAARLRRTGGDVPALRLIEARYAGLAGDRDRAATLLDSLPAAMPERWPELARHRLRMNDPAAAIPLLDQARADAADDVQLWALTELAWRATGDPRHDALVQDGHVAAVMIGLSTDELATLAGRLRDLHRRRWPPLGQSVRSGTQTRGDLRLTGGDTIAHLFTRLEGAVADHWVELPGRRAAPRIVNSWSIRIEAAGHHVGHVHPGGVFSSAFHVAVPGMLNAGTQEGWLEIGRPPDDIPLALDPLAAFAPVPGRLVLFPSFLYHNTRPFADGERISVAFDVGASGRPL